MNIKATDPTLKEVVDTISVQSVFNEEENSDPSDWIGKCNSVLGF